MAKTTTSSVQSAWHCLFPIYSIGFHRHVTCVRKSNKQKGLGSVVTGTRVRCISIHTCPLRISLDHYAGRMLLSHRIATHGRPKNNAFHSLGIQKRRRNEETRTRTRNRPNENENDFIHASAPQHGNKVDVNVRANEASKREMPLFCVVLFCFSFHHSHRR